MAVHGLTYGWFGSSDGPLRPSDAFWRDVARMHRVDADSERSVFEAAFPPELEGMQAAEQWQAKQRGGWTPKSHTDRQPRPNKTEEMEIFDSVFFADED